MFHSFAEPLFDHALIIQVTRPRQPVDARQHPRIHAQRDGHGLGGFGAAGHRGLHQAQVRPVLGPKVRLGIFGVEERNFFPSGKRSHLKFGFRFWRLGSGADPSTQTPDARRQTQSGHFSPAFSV